MGGGLGSELFGMHPHSNNLLTIENLIQLLLLGEVPSMQNAFRVNIEKHTLRDRCSFVIEIF